MTAVPLLGGCTPEVGRDMNPVEVAGLPADLSRVLLHASLAPSSHNTQPWYVHVKSRYEWTVGIDSGRTIPVTDPDNREMLLSLGAFMENLFASAGAAGYHAGYRLIGNDKTAAGDILSVNIEKTRATDFVTSRFATRRTVRRAFSSVEIDSATVKRLLSHFDGHAAYHTMASPTGRLISDATALAFEKESHDVKAQRELADWIRFSDREINLRRDGLTPQTMEAGGLAALYMKTFMDRESVMSAGFVRQGIAMARAQVKTGAGWIVAWSDGDGRASVIEAGRRYECMALRLAEERLVAHPMSAALHVAPWKDGMAKDTGAGGPVQFLLRIGHLEGSAYPAPVSLRRPLSDFVTDV